MIDEVKVENFRGFKDLAIRDLAKINLIVGKNATGKTTILESLFLVEGGHPEVAVRLKGWRGSRFEFGISSTRRSFEGFWQDLFFQLDQSNEISISIFSSGEKRRSVKIYYKESETLTLPLDSMKSGETSIMPIIMEWTDAEGKVTEIPSHFTGQGLEIKGRAIPDKVVFFNSSLTTASENAHRFSELSKLGKEGSVIDSIKTEFPFIENLSAETHVDSWEIHAKLAHLPEKIPLSMVSAGINKFLSILLGIADQKGGIVLVDEIDNGFFHDKLPSIWRIFHEFCSSASTQLFATTHSMECLRAILPLVEKHPKDFSLLRTDLKDGELRVEKFDGRELGSAIKQEIDVR